MRNQEMKTKSDASRNNIPRLAGKTARAIILDRLKEHAIAGDASYPSYSHLQAGPVDLRQAFKGVLESVGGECYFAADYGAARGLIAASGILPSPGQVCSYVEEIVPGNFDAEVAADVRECRDVRVTLVKGEFGVAENGAVWVDASGLRHRGLLFLTESLVLVLEGRDIVPDMESAYAQINFGRVRSGYFISGPSKTADIEQCLVIGAHGAKSLIVVVIG
jgi:L-lactate dehydrogenase complex protein LldG